MKIIEPSAVLLAITPYAQDLIEQAGRVCWQSELQGDPGAFIRRLIKRGHLSPLEHASATFRIICDRAIANEIVRHRLASYSQESTRYCTYDDLQVINPGLCGDELEIWISDMKSAEATYGCLIRHNAPQVARSVLPLCLKTELIMTANFREWRHFFELRLFQRTGKVHPQMHLVAELCYMQLAEKAPDVFSFEDAQ